MLPNISFYDMFFTPTVYYSIHHSVCFPSFSKDHFFRCFHPFSPGLSFSKGINFISWYNCLMNLCTVLDHGLERTCAQHLLLYSFSRGRKRKMPLINSESRWLRVFSHLHFSLREDMILKHIHLFFTRYYFSFWTYNIGECISVLGNGWWAEFGLPLIVS